MPERWDRELGKLADLDTPATMRSRISEGPRGEGVPPLPGRGQRIVAGIVAFVVFGGAMALALGALGDGDTSPATNDATATPTGGLPTPIGEGNEVTVPDLIGLDDQAAMLALDDLGLGWIVGYREHPDVPRWEVVGQAPPPGVVVSTGSRVSLEVATRIMPLPQGAADALDCGANERVAFGGPNHVLLPSGALYITANLPGIERTDQVMQITSTSSDPRFDWDGLWHVIRDGEVIAVVDYPSLDGVACDLSGVAGA